MKNIENKTKLNDMELAAVAGGDDDWTVVDAFVEWLLSHLSDAVDGSSRPLPFPQDRRGNRAS